MSKYDSYADECILPTHYTEREGKNYIPWIYGGISRKSLVKKRDKYTVIVCGIRLHSLHFSPHSNPTFAQLWDDPRWDCVNGWTRPIPSTIEE